MQWLFDFFQPHWAAKVFLALLVLVLIFGYRSCCCRGAARQATKHHVGFQQFQQSYLLVYYIVFFADWLQGTHMYSLYSSYASQGKPAANATANSTWAAGRAWHTASLGAHWFSAPIGGTPMGV